MLTRVHALPTRFFYAIGNTPAVSLVSHQPPGSESVDILLLGCGDPRNILYTVYCNENDDLKPKKLTFSCCDIEPAILARNTMFFSYLLEESDDDPTNVKAWAMIYSVNIDSACFQAIHEQALRLTHVSRTFSDWNKSKYGQIIKFIDAASLSQVRSYWLKYLDLCKLSPEKLDQTRKRFMREFRDIQKGKFMVALSGLRSVGATAINAMEVVPEAFQAFWKEGVVCGLPEFAEAATYVNPLFIFSKVGEDKCVLHYGSDPILGFHSGVAFADTLSRTHSTYQNETLEDKVHRLGRTVVQEFKHWCSTFRSLARKTLSEPGLLKIHQFCGDASSLCYSFQVSLGKIEPSANPFQAAKAPWQANLNLDIKSTIMGPFDVIDTSNIADHLGLLNILICALPILKTSPSSVLYTENLVQAKDDRTPQQRLASLLCGDPATMFCLLRAAPMECLTGITSYCSFSDEGFFRLFLEKDPAMGVTQIRWRFSWKQFSLADQNASAILGRNSGSEPTVTWGSEALAHVVSSVFFQMFKDEDITAILQSIMKPHMPQFYTPASFVALLGLVQRQHHTSSWEDFFVKVIDAISTDPFALKSQYAQEVFLQMHIQRLFTGYVLQEALRSSSLHIPSSWRNGFGNSLPYTIPLVFRIPRDRYGVILKEFNPVEACSDIVFEINVVCPPVHNRYSVIHLAFADQCQTEAIPSTWRQSSDLLVFVHLPTWTILMSSRKATEISLRLHCDIVTIRQFGHVLHELTIFQTSIFNEEYVIPIFTEKSLPIIPSQTPPTSMDRMICSEHFRTCLPKINLLNDRLEATTRIDLMTTSKNLLAAGVKVEPFQRSPCTLGVRLGQLKMEVILPFPATTSSSRFRLARKSGWIEVITPIVLCNPTGSAFPRFPVIVGNDAQFYAWNLPRLSLRLLPELDLLKKGDLSWINMNLSSAFSSRERSLHNRHLKALTTGDVLADVKENLFSLFTMSAGVGRTATSKIDGPQKVFFIDLEDLGVICVIFVVGMRLELHDGTLVVDSFVLPLEPPLVARLNKELARLSAEECVGLRGTREAYELWTKYIKTSVERCRVWNHRRGCLGTSENEIHSREDRSSYQQFLCDCGKGKVTEEFKRARGWRAFSPFVTRCLITPIFSVPWRESSIPLDLGEGSNLKFKSGEKVNGSSCCVCNAKEAKSGGKLMQCIRCKKATYCSRECQRKDWKQHKGHCQI